MLTGSQKRENWFNKLNFHWRAASADVFSSEASSVPNILIEIDLCAIGGDLVDEAMQISGVAQTSSPGISREDRRQ